ncbi:ankyrin repeat, PH and SEC7 domain containing protein secG-like [Uloborus diversus]|uniref:ankyrin repeat, PH and SEC7 domain containing protein secG-like n=1 Tax=Uloborus diversus TaxID=327109 RepID=UPI0024096C31|nr:ankyrin repeat, PH and SEC7 domain containing protein secG-like [Uloborus diversus]
MAAGNVPKRTTLAVFQKMPMEYVPCSASKQIFSERLLVEAAAIGDLDTVESLLNAGVAVDAKEYNKALFYSSKNYATPLHLAAGNGFVKCVEFLLKRGACVNAKDRFDITPLHMAAQNGHFSCLVTLLDANADCMMATKYTVAGSSVPLPHYGGTTALHLAAANNHARCVKELILYGADYNAVDERGRTSLYIAAQLGHRECVMAHLKNAVGRDILSLPSFHTYDTPLHFAVSCKMADCVYELLKLGSDPSHRNFNGISPLHLTLRGNDNVSFEILKMLVLEGYNTNINVTDKNGFTPLHYACFERKFTEQVFEMIKFLISYGADVNIKNTCNCSLLEYELISTDEDYSVLKQVVKSMLAIPHLNALRLVNESFAVLKAGVHFAAEDGIRRQRILQYFMNRYFPDNEEMDEEQFDLAYAVNVEPLMNIGLDDPARLAMIDDMRRLQHFGSFAPRQYYPPTDINPSDKAAFYKEKHFWYEDIASNPRTLQHCCRYAIRKALGPKNLKHAHELPLPSSFLSYLLLETEVI